MLNLLLPTILPRTLLCLCWSVLQALRRRYNIFDNLLEESNREGWSVLQHVSNKIVAPVPTNDIGSLYSLCMHVPY